MNTRGKYFLQGNNILTDPKRAEQKIASTPNVYEVVRIINGFPLFCEQHCVRLSRSAMHLKLNYRADPETMFCRIRKLVLHNGIETGNVRITLTVPGEEDDLYLYFIGHHYPDKRDYNRGVALCSMHARRPDPNAKIANLPLRKNADALIRAENVFEVLLIDNNDFVTEGSRSNIFFVTDEHIMTPELQQVLPGITRQAVMDICRNNNIVVREGKIKYDDIDRYMGAFITGTSPGVLPVKKIDKVTFDAQIPVVRLIMQKYDERVNDYFNGLKYICDENR